MFVTASRSSPIGEPTTDPIHFVTQFYIPADALRYAEIKLALRRNVDNQHVSTVVLLNERVYTDEELGLSSAKIVQTVLARRIQFRDAWANRRSGYTVLANADIYLDETIDRVRTSDLHSRRSMYALLRHEPTGLFGPRADSQDTWILHSNSELSATQLASLRFDLGRPGCDNKVCYLLSITGFEIYNDPEFIRTHHLHAAGARDYPTPVERPYLNVLPANMDSAFCGHSSTQISGLLHTYDFVECNSNLRRLISTDHFIIPRIAGVENNTAHAGFLRRDVPNEVKRVMKVNAGIYLTNAASVAAYSDAYLKAFHCCDAYASWEPWGNYERHISASQRFIQARFVKHEFGAFAFDIFHYLHDPWTHALRGKRILIVSPFVDMIREQPQAYATDLFPECTFAYLKPPQTHGTERSREWSQEFADFCAAADSIEFDVALCSCGGYGNPICAHIYSTGRSAIYVGGVLQMYFGLYGGRWLKERKDVISLHLRKEWKRPTLKPLGHDAIESSCYW